MPHAPSGIDFAAPKAVVTLAENTESCFSSFVLWQDGHSTVVPLRTSVSNRLLHFPHTYSNIGIASTSLDRTGRDFSRSLLPNQEGRFTRCRPSSAVAFGA